MRSLPTVLVALVSAAAFGLYVAVPPMAMPEFADTEVSTNIPVNVFRSDVRGLDVSVELCATLSNNVQVAFGRDADGDGVLAPEESDLVVGWDCGRWFAEEVATGARTFAEDKLANWVERTTNDVVNLHGPKDTNND